MRLFLVKLVLRYLDIPLRPMPNEHTESFFAHAYLDEGFKRYLSARERKLKDFIADTVKLAPSPTQLMALGQLQELLNMQQLAQKAFDALREKKKSSTPKA